MTTRWQLKDIIDLEYFLHTDASFGPRQLKERDRGIYLARGQDEAAGNESVDRRAMLGFWLEQRRRQEIAAAGGTLLLPGEAFDEIYKLMAFAVTVFGLLIGGGLAFSFLNYSGVAPLNVSTYFGVFVLLQILLVILLLVLLLTRAATRSLAPSSAFYSLTAAFAVRVIRTFKRKVWNRLTGNQRSGIQALAGLMRGKQQVYGALFYWPAFILAQIFGVGFNVGVLGATLLCVVGADMAFGWQSTLQVSPQVVHSLVSHLAAPWSWMVPADLAHPSLAQIEGSRMILKDGIYHLETQALVSWWTFLFFCVLVYGFLPRVVLLMAGIAARKRKLVGLTFTDSACDGVVHRMRTPLMTTGAEPSDRKPQQQAAPELSAGPEPAGNKAPDADRSPLIVLIPDDIYDGCNEKELAGVVRQAMGNSRLETVRIWVDDASDRALMDRLATPVPPGHALPRVFILFEAWQPPIAEVLTFLGDLRSRLGAQSPILIGLIGKPGSASIFTPVKMENWQAWQRKIDSMGDPYLRVERLVEDEQ